MNHRMLCFSLELRDQRWRCLSATVLSEHEARTANIEDPETLNLQNPNKGHPPGPQRTPGRPFDSSEARNPHIPWAWWTLETVGQG